jgi:hypothetical protein
MEIEMMGKEASYEENLSCVNLIFAGNGGWVWKRD